MISWALGDHFAHSTAVENCHIVPSSFNFFINCCADTIIFDLQCRSVPVVHCFKEYGIFCYLTAAIFLKCPLQHLLEIKCLELIIILAFVRRYIKVRVWVPYLTQLKSTQFLKTIHQSRCQGKSYLQLDPTVASAKLNQYDLACHFCSVIQQDKSENVQNY